ncbi:MAG: 1-acyl-sn-glycerol-3-phosphate acyltransferase [Minisyncoccia bacterium]
MHWYHYVLPTLIQVASKPFWFLGLKFQKGLTIEGIEHVRHAITLAQSQKKGVLLISNHVSLLDFAYVISGLMYTELVFKPVIFVGDQGKNYTGGNISWQKYFFTSALFMKSVGAWPAERGTGNYEQALSAHAGVLQRGGTVCIFPYGGITNKTTVHGGAGYLAESTSAIVVPLTITIDAGKTRVSYKKHTTFQSEMGASTSTDTPEQRAEGYRQFAKNILSS